MNYLREKNVARATEDFKTYKNAGLLYFTTAIAGEAGELGELVLLALLNKQIGSLCNLVKKVERAKVGGPDIGHTSKLKTSRPRSCVTR